LYPQATVTFKRSDGAVSPELLMTQSSITHNAETFEGFEFDFYDAWFLGISGQLEMTVRLYSGTIIDAQGKLTMSVQNSVSPTVTTITVDQYQDIISRLALMTYDVDRIVFNEDYEPGALESGTLYYDKTTEHKTLTYYHVYENGQALDIQLNQSLHGIGKNDTNQTIYKGEVCYFSDVQGHHILMDKANANINVPYKNAMIGVAATQTAKNQYGPVYVFGYIHGVDLELVMEAGTNFELIEFGTKLYLSATDNGKYSLSVPSRPNAAIWVATVIDFNTNQFNNATLFVNPQKERIEGGVNIQLSDTQPTGQIEGDLWYDID
jgi:hypothetical protein